MTAPGEWSPLLAPPVAERDSRRSLVVVAGLVALPATGYLLLVLGPWLRGEGAGQAGGLLLGMALTAFTLLGALVALAASSVVLLSYVQRARATRAMSSAVPWLVVASVSLAVAVWFTTPAGAALTGAQFD